MVKSDEDCDASPEVRNQISTFHEVWRFAKNLSEHQ